MGSLLSLATCLIVGGLLLESGSLLHDTLNFKQQARYDLVLWLGPSLVVGFPLVVGFSLVIGDLSYSWGLLL